MSRSFRATKTTWGDAASQFLTAEDAVSVLSWLAEHLTPDAEEFMHETHDDVEFYINDRAATFVTALRRMDPVATREAYRQSEGAGEDADDVGHFLGNLHALATSGSLDAMIDNDTLTILLD